MVLKGNPSPVVAAGLRAEERKLNLQIARQGKITWVNIERPTRDEIEWLRQNYRFHPPPSRRLS